jgi:NTP pyrophosphatase (non-canonical NTP hydrolase)
MTTFEDYQRNTEDTAIYPEEHGLVYATLGLANEAGEVAGKVKKLIRDNDFILTREIADDIADELGDVLWYLARTAEEVGWRLEDIAVQNLYKLEDRKRRGKLSGSGDKR